MRDREFAHRQISVGRSRDSGAVAPPPASGRWLTVKGARENNLRDLTVAIPLGVIDLRHRRFRFGQIDAGARHALSRARAETESAAANAPGAYKTLDGVEHLDKVIHVDQSPIGRTPRSNPATYTGLFTHIRDLFAQLPEARMRGYGPGPLFVQRQGRPLRGVRGRRHHPHRDALPARRLRHLRSLRRQALQSRHAGDSVQGQEHRRGAQHDGARRGRVPRPVPPIRQKLETLRDVGLDYIHLGQSATTLSGGEAQRIKLAKELARRATGRTLYILDEPTTGLHFDDIKRLLGVLGRLADTGNTVVVIEHNLDVIKTADYIIDLGPEGGDRGGQVVAKGTPEEVAGVKASYTAGFLRQALNHRAAA